MDKITALNSEFASAFVDFATTVVNFFEKLWEDAQLIVDSFVAFGESLWHFSDIVPWFIIGSINFVLTIVVIKSIFFGGVDT